MTINSSNINELSSYLIINELYKCGIKAFFISPGSRSTALTIAVANLSKSKHDVSVHIAVDERASAYMCLGYSQATDNPGVLICTSGTAVANYFPAIVETYFSKNKMVVLSADRPDELLDTGANQAIYQDNIYGKYTKYLKNIECSDVNLNIRNLLSTIDYAVYSANSSERGIVHLNCKYREPFISNTELSDLINPEITQVINTIKPYTEYNLLSNSRSSDLKELDISVASPIMIILGKMKRNESEEVLRFAESNNLPIFADLLSGVRFSKSRVLIKHYDLWINNINVKFHPATILHFGTTIISKQLQQYIDKVTKINTEYIIINSKSGKYDPSSNASRVIAADVLTTLNSLKIINNNDTLLNYFLELSNGIIKTGLLYQTTTNNILENNIVTIIARLIPNDSNLFLGNSLTIRNFDDYYFYDNKSEKSINIFANRGASGIDGNIATAVGIAEANTLPTTIVIGDLSAFHDINSLYLAARSTVKIVIVLINNNGGGIFHRLPVSNNENFEEYFATPLNIDFDKIASGFKFVYSSPKNLQDFEIAYKKSFLDNSNHLIEIKTDRASNEINHSNILNNISKYLVNKNNA